MGSEPPRRQGRQETGETSFAERPFAPRYLLSPFELRYAADAGAIHPVPLAARRAAGVRLPRTDLHTHFAGCVHGRDLVQMGAERGVVYPQRLFEEAKIRVHGDARLADLTEAIRERLADRLVVPLDRRVTFLEMERVYRLRSSLTKAGSMRLPLLRRIAEDYARMGVVNHLQSARSVPIRRYIEAGARVVLGSDGYGIYQNEGGGRDPRDTSRSWSRSTSFLIELNGEEGASAVAGGDDAADAAWFAVDRLPPSLAFDHGRIIEQAILRRGER